MSPYVSNGPNAKRSLSEVCKTIPAFQHEGKPFPHPVKPYPLTVYFDGECPICRCEIDLMKIFNRRGLLQFIDFSIGSCRPAEHGLSLCDLERVIHARWSDGSIITGVEVFREMWEAIGLAFLARFARRPTINKILVRAYAWFAKNRLWLTGRA
jgi:predicted DCC family thiol-disulfide oxidoreductase YuxK